MRRSSEDRVSSVPRCCVLCVLGFGVGKCVLVVLWMFLSPKVLQMRGILDPTEGLGGQCSGDPTLSGGLEGPLETGAMESSGPQVGVARAREASRCLTVWVLMTLGHLWSWAPPPGRVSGALEGLMHWPPGRLSDGSL